jgi:hypothetical protein
MVNFNPRAPSSATDTTNAVLPASGVNVMEATASDPLRFCLRLICNIAVASCDGVAPTCESPSITDVAAIISSSDEPVGIDAMLVGHCVSASVGAVAGFLASIAALIAALFAARAVSCDSMLMTALRC